MGTIDTIVVAEQSAQDMAAYLAAKWKAYDAAIAAAALGNVVAAAAVADIAVPSTATAEDVANKVNALLASLRSAGLLAV